MEKKKQQMEQGCTLGRLADAGARGMPVGISHTSSTFVVATAEYMGDEERLLPRHLVLRSTEGALRLGRRC